VLSLTACAWLVLVSAFSVAWAVFATAALLKAARRRRERAHLRAVLKRGEDFQDTSVANYAARFLAASAQRRADQRAAKLKEAGL
jgi:hypothetical protein